MSEATIRAAAATLLRGVSGMGTVISRIKEVHSENDFNNAFVASSKINVWFVTREGTEASFRAMGRGSGQDRLVIHNYILEGWYGLEDSSNTEQTFNDLIENIGDTFASNCTLGGTNSYQRAIQVEEIDHDTLGGRLCHHAILKLEVPEFK